MQPLDYMFEILLLIFFLIEGVKFYLSHVKVNVKTTDDLIERYIIYESRRQSKVRRQRP